MGNWQRVRLYVRVPGSSPKRYRIKWGWKRKPTSAELLLAAARGEVGVRETPAGSNSGVKVREYQRTTTVPGTGWPWCQAFVRWCMDRANAHTHGYRGAYVPDFEKWARAAKLFHTKNTRPQPGWAVIFGTPRIAEHVGIVEKVHPDGSLLTIEGNTLAAGQAGSQANGGGVHRRTRNLEWVRGYVEIV